jgi:predicted 3-demethylubiquinone-9 3-methyltransferase (glyoxalase superfamily)
MQRITPGLWFNDNAEMAVKFYASIFKNSKINTVTHYGEAGACVSGRPVGTVMTIAFQLEGQEFLALNGGPHFSFSPAISLVVSCKTQREIDGLRRKLGAGGRIDQCGWLQDKFGVSWQIVPSDIGKMVRDRRDGKSDQVMKAIPAMKKIDVAALKRSRAMRAARPLAFVHVDPEDGTRAPETSNLDAWAHKADRRTDGLLGHRLASVVDATTVRLRKGHVLITDGPFIETKQ